MKLYEIEEDFPENKVVSSRGKMLSKKLAIRFFENLLAVLDQANNLGSNIFMEGE